MIRMNLQMFGGSGSGSGSGGAGPKYQKRDTPHEITLKNSNGMTFKAQSYGEGWKNGYHVRQTDRYGGEFIDKGSVGGYKIGETVQVPKTSFSGKPEMQDGKIIMAHKYPNGSIDFNVETNSAFGTNRSNYKSSSIKKKRRK